MALEELCEFVVTDPLDEWPSFQPQTEAGPHEIGRPAPAVAFPDGHGTKCQHSGVTTEP